MLDSAFLHLERIIYSRDEKDELENNKIAFGNIAHQERTFSCAGSKGGAVEKGVWKARSDEANQIFVFKVAAELIWTPENLSREPRSYYGQSADLGQMWLRIFLKIANSQKISNKKVLIAPELCWC